jgi:Flp pilus assembly protein TadG
MKTRIRQLERGSVSVEWAIAAPIAFFLLMMVVQVAIWAHATHTAQSAAGTALTAARVEEGSAAAGGQSAENAIADYGGGSLVDPAVSVSRGTETVTVTVTGTAESLIPGLELPVTASISGPVEVFRPDTEGD